ncbi:MAG: bifunctional nuclease family protein [Treponema sp.]|jgi:bifunctional DNase/RNase|nr:bifunctional nuclease family protein [Treponema sp.]
MREMLVSDIWSVVKVRHGNAVLLKPRGIDSAVPIFIGTLEMQSILLALEGKALARPMTHDLFLNMLNHVNLSIKRIEIYELKDDTFHARLVMTGGEYSNENPLILDSRASDAIAIAVRKKCPIFIFASVIEQTGIPLDFFLEPLEETPDDKNKSLLEQLEQAVAEEEYEQAAEIRDLIKKLESNDDGS